MLGHGYDWLDEVGKMTSPTMLVVGDADSVQTSHAVEFFELLGGGKKDAGWDGSGVSKARLAILPGTTHYQIFASSLRAPVVLPFLGPAPSKECRKKSNQTDYKLQRNGPSDRQPLPLDH